MPEEMKQCHLTKGPSMQKKALGFSFKYRCGNTGVRDIKPRERTVGQTEGLGDKEHPSAQVGCAS